MDFVNFFTILGLCPFIYGALASSQCSDENLNITEGSFTLTRMYNDGSILQYICSEGYYPHPVKKRNCLRGKWDPEPTKRQPVCKKVTCPNPKGFLNGYVDPHKPVYHVNDTTTYSCHTGYKFRGSSMRVCKANGKWSGETPICSYDSDHCPDPGTPPGASRKGNTFNIDDTVTYTCDKNLKLIGSKERVCQDDRQWSGKEPECYAYFTYDTPEEVAAIFGNSLKHTLSVHEDEGQYEKRIRLEKGGQLDIYIALDASDSIEPDDFEEAKRMIIELINKISYYQVSPNYEIIIFATEVTKIISMADYKNSKENPLDILLKKLENYKYDARGQKSGTNVASAYHAILESINFEKSKKNNNFHNTSHVVIMFTDGEYNEGGSPKRYVDDIKQIVCDGKIEREMYLDLYVFGVNADVKNPEIDEWVTKRDNNEKHIFFLKDISNIQETFDQIIDEANSVGLCGLYRGYSNDHSHMRFTFPWLIHFVVTHEDGTTDKCLGSLVTPRFILTAAHCFKFGDIPEKIKAEAIGAKGLNIQLPSVNRYIPHPGYNIKQKQTEGISEYYENDVALIELSIGIQPKTELRPICIPCTKETSGALKLNGNDVTCKKHKEVLMKSNLVKASFMSDKKNNIQKKNVQVKLGQMRDGCIEDTHKALNITKDTAKSLITEKFLCTGGAAKNEVDDIACKGDSGGATFVEQTYRQIQVGIVSWGLKDVCTTHELKEKTRDFHTNLFSPQIQDFLKTYLGDEKIDTPLNFLE